MVKNEARSRNPLVPALATLLAALHVLFAVGAVRHAGVHLDDGLDWLPAAFHHHSFSITSLPDDARLEALDPCIACQASRVAWRLPVSSVGAPEDAVVARTAACAPSRAVPCTDPSTRTTRGPPLG